MLPGQMELHDAVIKSMRVDYEEKSVVIELDFYASDDAKHREPVSLMFHEVSSISKICDLNALRDNAYAGNVVYWHPSPSSGTTFIYLTEGCIAITSARVTVCPRTDAALPPDSIASPGQAAVGDVARGKAGG
jgi:hypothetical protein